MQKDFKIGTALGLLIVAVVSLWLAVQPKLSVKARMGVLPPDDIISTQQSPALPHPLAAVAEPNISALSETADSNEVKDGRQQTAITSEQPIKSPALTADTIQKPKPLRIHSVQRGDTLSGISYKYYGSSNKWQKILDANRSILKNPNKLTPGTKLIIP